MGNLAHKAERERDRVPGRGRSSEGGEARFFSKDGRRPIQCSRKIDQIRIDEETGIEPEPSTVKSGGQATGGLLIAFE
ncbi:hypothetical protein DM860_004770 [Cuscuta australis]|uniref:Uncharacterized protein n=1 Tax=Cuscuta australis TaxID=267555 RepID=A0A328DQF6_9ASTE|nr:hypothetical protein DM860_004770 [Cuscuta australis]